MEKTNVEIWIADRILYLSLVGGGIVWCWDESLKWGVQSYLCKIKDSCTTTTTAKIRWDHCNNMEEG